MKKFLVVLAMAGVLVLTEKGFALKYTIQTKLWKGHPV
jgi:hypothetical protein